ncbi:MAG: thiol-disulfide oxidoreductase DCC family protein [Bacteroidota bacterium]
MQLPEHKKIILFDGVCNLCNGAVQFIIKRDKNDVFRFAALQDAIGRQLMEERGIDPSNMETIILIEPQVAYYIKSSAALHIAYEFGGLWKALKLFEWLPVRLRDGMYNIVARNRYKWFGKKESCMIPTPELKAKFLN